MEGGLFPAHAGVILKHTLGGKKGLPIPRPCGGDPSCVLLFAYPDSYSPPMRG